MKPSIGRIVHYVTRGTADGVYPSIHRAAIVTDVHAGAVTLTVFHPTFTRPEMDVPHDETGTTGHSWHWPERES